MSVEIQQTKLDDQSLLDACAAYQIASVRMRRAMDDGVNIHGAMSDLIGATVNLQHEVNESANKFNLNG